MYLSVSVKNVHVTYENVSVLEMNAFQVSRISSNKAHR